MRTKKYEKYKDYLRERKIKKEQNTDSSDYMISALLMKDNSTKSI